jgi:hypothetical protein
MQRTQPWVAIGFLLASCSVDDVDPPRPRGGDNDAQDAGQPNRAVGDDDDDIDDIDDNDEIDVDDTSGGPSGARHLASGAKAQIVNAYAPLNEAPGPIDIYAEPWASKGDKPLLSVPYGQVSKWFDPTVVDDDGNAFLSVYWSGTVGNGNALMSKTETLKGGELITYFVTTGGETQDSGRRYAAMQTFFADTDLVPFNVDVSTQGKAFLIVDSVGIDQVIENPEDVIYNFSLGDGCAKAIGDNDFSLTGVGPGTSGTYLLDPGSYTGSIHARAFDDFDPATCDGQPILDNLTFDLEADQKAVLFIYAASDGDFRSQFVSLTE